MKALLIAVVAVVAMAFAGWLTFSRSDENVSISVNTAEVKADTKQIVVAGEKLIDELSDVADKSVDAVEESVGDVAEEPATTE